MIVRAKFRQTFHGRTYDRDDVYIGMTEDQEDEAVRLGIAYYHEFEEPVPVPDIDDMGYDEDEGFISD